MIRRFGFWAGFLFFQSLDASEIRGTGLQAFHWYTPADSQQYSRLRLEILPACAPLITALHAPPAHKGFGGIANVGYASYDFWDLGRYSQQGTVPTKYGTEAELLAVRRAAKSLGISWYADIVYNQMLGADSTEVVSVVKVDPQHRDHIISDPFDIDAFTHFEYAARRGERSQYVFTRDDFNGWDFDARRRENAVYRASNRAWDAVPSHEDDNFDFLMGANVDNSHPETVDELERNLLWLQDFLSLDGIRIDAGKHQSTEMYLRFLQKLRARNPQFFAVGEYVSRNLDDLREYFRMMNGSISIYDFPLHYNLHEASIDPNYDMRNLLRGTMMQDPELHAAAVTFIENHDTQPGQALESSIENRFRLHAYALILLRQEGYPFIFLPDITGVSYTLGERKVEIPNLFSDLTPILKARKNNTFGLQRDYFDDPRVVGWTASGNVEHPKGLAVLLSTNSSVSRKLMQVGTPTVIPREKFRDITGHFTEAISLDSSGSGVFPVSAQSISVWAED